MSRPYLLTTWHGGYYDRGSFSTFTEALTAYVALGVTLSDDPRLAETRQIINSDRADSGSDGLTSDERAAVLEAA